MAYNFSIKFGFGKNLQENMKRKIWGKDATYKNPNPHRIVPIGEKIAKKVNPATGRWV